MKEMSSVKKSIICAVCIALCYVLPLFFHGIQNAGSVFCPMHIPVILCGLICGGPFGLLCGLAGPLMSCLLTGMPTVIALPAMMAELGVYGLVSGMLMKFIRTGYIYIDLYVSMIIAMVIGRIVAGIVKALMFTAGGYTVALWVSSYLVTCWPGIVVQLLFIPTIVIALVNAHLIPAKYSAKDKRKVA